MAVRLGSSWQVMGKTALSRSALDGGERPRTEEIGARYGANFLRGEVPTLSPEMLTKQVAGEEASSLGVGQFESREYESPSNDAGASTLPSFIAFSAPALSPIFKTPYAALDRL
jgi:hypothetical protein